MQNIKPKICLFVGFSEKMNFSDILYKNLLEHRIALQVSFPLFYAKKGPLAFTLADYFKRTLGKHGIAPHAVERIFVDHDYNGRFGPMEKEPEEVPNPAVKRKWVKRKKHDDAVIRTLADARYTFLTNGSL